MSTKETEAEQSEQAGKELEAPASGTESDPFLARVLLTGASGFVGQAVVRQLVAAGHKPVCLVRDQSAFTARMAEVPSDRYTLVTGDLFDASAVAQAAEGAEAAIHLVGIIAENRLKRQTFERVHFEGTCRVVDACQAAGVRRYVHMSALGTRPHAASRYHRTKWAAETYVRESGLDWTIFRPSIIHGPDAAFMRMMRTIVCDATVPVCFGMVPAPFPLIPYFGDGQGKVQPVSLKDVAHCFTAALSTPETIGRTYELGGPEAMSWKGLYRACRELIPGAKTWKPMIGQPVWAARLMARTVMRLPILPKMLRFDEGQVVMSQEDSVCDIAPVEEAFGIALRDFRKELAAYAGQIE